MRLELNMLDNSTKGSNNTNNFGNSNQIAVGLQNGKEEKEHE